MKVLKIILIVLGLLFAAFLIWSSFLPSEVVASQTRRMEKPRGLVFEYVADFTLWQRWSPWKDNDETMEFEYPEETVGPDATYLWTSENSGNGQMWCIGFFPDDSLHTHIVFEGMGEGYGRWVFNELGANETEVTWSFKTELGFWERWQGSIFKNIMENQFENGLKNLENSIQ